MLLRRDGVGDAEHGAEALAGVVGPIEITLAQDVVEAYKERQRTGVEVFHLKGETDAHGEGVGNGVETRSGVIIDAVARHGADEEGLEVGNHLVLVVDVGGEVDVELGQVKERVVLDMMFVAVDVAAQLGREHLVVDKGEVGTDGGTNVIAIIGLEDVAQGVLAAVGTEQEVFGKDIELSAHVEF